MNPSPDDKHTQVDMGTQDEARQNLVVKAEAWRTFRQPLIAPASEHRKRDSQEREAGFQLCNAAVFWLWHEENSASPPPAAAPDVEAKELVDGLIAKSRIDKVSSREGFEDALHHLRTWFIDALTAASAAMAQKVADTERIGWERCDALATEITAMRADVESAEQSLATARAEVESLKGSLVELRGESDVLALRVIHLRAELDFARAERNVAQRTGTADVERVEEMLAEADAVVADGRTWGWPKSDGSGDPEMESATNYWQWVGEAKKRHAARTAAKDKGGTTK